MDWAKMHTLREHNGSVAALLERYSDVFAPDLGTGYSGQIYS
jgi:hypothetical protein